MTDMRTQRLDSMRRRAMVWMLHAAGVSHANIAAAFGLSVTRVYEMRKGYQRAVERRQRETATWSEPWAKRLRAAGAIR